jgi:hypothetical protein
VPLATGATARAGRRAVIAVRPATRAVVSWNAASFAVGVVEVRLRFLDGTWSARLPYAECARYDTRSFSEGDGAVRIAVDLIASETPFDAVEVGASDAAAWWAVATRPAPASDETHDARLPVRALDVPRRTQYLVDYPTQRGWCSPASVAMLLAYHGIERDVADVAKRVYDVAYDGTGNWALNVAYAGACGLAAAVVTLGGLADAARFIAAGLPLAVSYRWKPGELAGAPIAQSSGHLGVLRGFDESGDVLLNDPARPAVAVAYDAREFRAAWARSNFTAYAIDANRERLTELANG